MELIAGAKEFKLGFSGMRLTPEEMASNIKVSVSQRHAFTSVLTATVDPCCHLRVQDGRNTDQAIYPHDLPQNR
jgi:hypothetical protein